jgi:uncharacterized integral membrane protein (TIGR00697 family)
MSKPKRTYKYYDLLMAAFVTVILCSNLIGVHMTAQIDLPFVGAFVFGTGVLFFPLSYLFGDILTEVYGYARSRKVIWAGFTALIFASFMSMVVTGLEPAEVMSKERYDAVQMIFGNTPRIVAASLIAFFVGEYVNSYVIAKMKIATAGRYLWTRTIGSTVAGEFADTIIFYPLAFWGTRPNEEVIAIMVANYILKVMWEVLATPFTYRIVAFLKKAENEDYYDTDTDFTPFSLETN